MVLPRADWKNQQHHTLDWIAVVVALALLVAYGYLWSVSAGEAYLILTLGFVALLLTFFTKYWQPILYVLAAIPVAIVSVLLLQGPSRDLPGNRIVVGLNVVFVLVALTLWILEEREGTIEN